MKKFTTFTSTVCPIFLNNIDTDMLIPAQFLTSTQSGGYGENVFRRLRDEDPDFPLNHAIYKDSEIIVAGLNFGCGSSREHAVWALVEWGIKAVISSSFADIFKSNAAKNGLLLIELPESQTLQIAELVQKNPLTMTVDLAAEKLTYDKNEVSFVYDQFRKECLLEGYDDLDYIWNKMPEITAYKAKRDQQLFYKTTQPNHL